MDNFVPVATNEREYICLGIKTWSISQPRNRIRHGRVSPQSVLLSDKDEQIAMTTREIMEDGPQAKLNPLRLHSYKRDISQIWNQIFTDARMMAT